MKKLVMILSVLLVTALCFTACGNGEINSELPEEYDYWADHGFEGGVSELDKLGELEINDGGDTRRLDYLRAFLEKDIKTLEELCAVEKGVYENYAKLDIVSWYAWTDENNRLKLAFALRGDSPIEVFSPDSVNIFDINTYQGSVYITRGLEEKQPESDAGRELWSFLNHGFSELPSTDDIGSSWHITCYLVERFAGGALSLDQMQAYANRIFGIEDFAPSDSHKSERGYEAFGHSGNRQSMSLISENKLSDDKYMIDVQFYADLSQTVLSHSFRYTVEKADGEWIFTDCEMLKEAKCQPMIDFE